MFEITGRIIMINVLSDKSAMIVIKKQINGKQIPIAIEVFGYWKEKFDELKLKPKDKITGRVYIKCNQYKGKWYTNLNFKEIKIYEAKPKFYKTIKSNQEQLFPSNEPYIKVDEETGEILL
jgi:hypothetical protein